jgi:hypothetical protein
LLLLSAFFTPPRSTSWSKPTFCRTLVRIFWTNLARKMPTMRISRK